MPRLYATLALCSLACCLLLCGLWVRSYHVRDIVWVQGRVPFDAYASSFNGGVLLMRGYGRDAFDWGWGRDEPATGAMWPTWGHGGNWVRCPIWPLAMFTAIPPLFWWLRRRRRRRTGFPVEESQDA